MVSTVSFTVAAKHVGHLQPGTIHGRAVLLDRGIGWIHRQPVEGADRLANLRGGNLQISGGRCQTAVPQQKLDRPDIRAGFEQVYSEGVPKRMWRHPFGKRTQLAGLLAGTLHRVGSRGPIRTITGK
jgi:hypothetical protein